MGVHVRMGTGTANSAVEMYCPHSLAHILALLCHVNWQKKEMFLNIAACVCSSVIKVPAVFYPRYLLGTMDERGLEKYFKYSISALWFNE